MRETVIAGPAIRQSAAHGTPSPQKAIGNTANSSRRGQISRWRAHDKQRLDYHRYMAYNGQGRVVTLNMSQLQAGDYSMIVSASRPGGVPATAIRNFWVTR